MSVNTLPIPADLKRRLESSLPQQGSWPARVHVTPRDADERSCAVWLADHYEVQVHYPAMDSASLIPLEEALQATPGVYLTTRAHGDQLNGDAAAFSNPDWPPPLGVRRRDRKHLRPQVMALMRDGGAITPAEPATDPGLAPTEDTDRSPIAAQRPAEGRCGRGAGAGRDHRVG